MRNPYIPSILTVAELRDETPDVRTLRLRMPTNGNSVNWQAGQFAQVTVFGVGECPFTFANSPTRKSFVECTFKLMGKVTSALREVGIGESVGLRGPYGNFFPAEDWRARDVLFVGGGIGMAALRAPLQFVLDHRNDYGEILILNGARTVADIVYKEEMKEWSAYEGVKLVRTVDPGGETAEWDGEVGLVPHVFENIAPKPNGSIVVTCGPPIMIHFMLLTLEKLGYRKEQVVTTLENKMKCGFGKCGRCNVGSVYVCKDGPVFTAAQLEQMPKEF